MRSSIWLLAAAALCITSIANANFYSTGNLYIPGPFMPTDYKQCTDFQARYDREIAYVSNQHEQCLKDHSKDAPSREEGGTCSRRECQHLHTAIAEGRKRASERAQKCHQDVAQHLKTEAEYKQRDDKRKAEREQRDRERDRRDAEWSKREQERRQREDKARADRDHESAQARATDDARKQEQAKARQEQLALQGAATSQADRSTQAAGAGKPPTPAQTTTGNPWADKKKDAAVAKAAPGNPWGPDAAKQATAGNKAGNPWDVNAKDVAKAPALTRKDYAWADAPNRSPWGYEKVSKDGKTVMRPVPVAEDFGMRRDSNNVRLDRTAPEGRQPLATLAKAVVTQSNFAADVYNTRRKVGDTVTSADGGPAWKVTMDEFNYGGKSGPPGDGSGRLNPASLRSSTPSNNEALPPGFHARTYSRVNANGVREVVVAIEGTTPDSGNSIARDAATAYPNSVGLSEQQQQAGLKYLEQVRRMYGEGARITVTGHSMGGNIAQYAGVRTNTPVVTFNAQPVPPEAYRHDRPEYRNVPVVNIRANDDPLTGGSGAVQKILSVLNLDRTSTTTTYYGNQYTFNTDTGHGMRDLDRNLREFYKLYQPPP